jgi:hypothetical protein
MSSLGYLARILGLRQLGHEAGILPVEIDKDEHRQDDDADETVHPESRGRTCASKQMRRDERNANDDQRPIADLP